MKIKRLLLIVLISVFVLFTPTVIKAKTSYNINHMKSYYKLDKGINDIEDTIDTYNQEQTCEGKEALLGDPEDPESVSWLLQQIFNFIKILGPILVVIMSSIDFAVVVVQSNDDLMAKAQKKLGWRLFLAILLFFIPTLVQLILDIFGITANPTCGIK